MTHRPYKLSDIANAADVSAETAKAWFRRGLATGLRDVSKPTGTGDHRRFSFESAVEFTVAAELRNRFGIPLEQAFDAARWFAHTGDGPLRGLHGARNPARPFADGDTFLLVRGEEAHVVNVPPEGNLLSHVPQTMRHGFIVLDLLDLYCRVVGVLGGDPLGDWRDQAEKFERYVAEQEQALTARNMAEQGDD